METSEQIQDMFLLQNQQKLLHHFLASINGIQVKKQLLQSVKQQVLKHTLAQFVKEQEQKQSQQKVTTIQQFLRQKQLVKKMVRKHFSVHNA